MNNGDKASTVLLGLTMAFLALAIAQLALPRATRWPVAAVALIAAFPSSHSSSRACCSDIRVRW